jgi:hypothetical protein
MTSLGRLRQHGWGVFSTRAQYIVLLVAILPSLTFLGHWSLNLDIPGTDLYLTLIAASHHDDEHAGHEDEQAHTNHCHANAASCTDVPFTGASPFALLHDSIAHLGAAALLVVLTIGAWRPWSTLTVGPEPRPPRRTFGTSVHAFAAAI